MFFMARTVCHIKFQFQLLGAYLENGFRKFNDSNINDEQRQRRIHQVLTKFVIDYLKIKKMCIGLFYYVHMAFPLLSFTGIIASATVVYSIKAVYRSIYTIFTALLNMTN
ncbi:hypothetical protein JTB14_011531 [Gonioctena quinquepunctata]|nr:hypothetical protein JTB14_011531 [Gonioctena quinquepunctata]